MLRILRALLAGLLLRCPQCWQGRLFVSGFTMRTECPACGMPFERSAGEVSGGMVINLVVSELIAMACSLWVGLFTTLPLMPFFATMALFLILFPIAFYRTSRGLWASILYLTGANLETD